MKVWLRVKDAARYLTQRLGRTDQPILPQYIRILARQGRVRFKVDEHDSRIHWYNRHDLDAVTLRTYTKKEHL